MTVEGMMPDSWRGRAVVMLVLLAVLALLVPAASELVDFGANGEGIR